MAEQETVAEHEKAAEHEPVLLAEVLETLAVRPGGFYVDGTVGLGGHAEAILRASAPDGRLMGTDCDAEALERAQERLVPFGARARLVHADYREIPDLLAGACPHGILLDLGLSSFQLDTAERGFSFRAEGPLDMRMDRSFGETAATIVNRMHEAELADLIYRYGEEPAARRIARAIGAARGRRPIETTAELASIVRRAVGRGGWRRLDPATRTFQALRIAINRELDGLGPCLGTLARLLAPGGRMAVISFHSLEDREAKGAFRVLSREGFRLVMRKALRPGAAEVAGNPRCRSARLRAIERQAA